MTIDTRRLDVDALLERVEQAAGDDYHVEITEHGDIHATMSPSQKHALDGRRLVRWLEQFVNDPLRILETGHISTVGFGRREPDIKVLTVDPELLPTDVWATPASFVALVVEIGSESNHHTTDWRDKMTAYAASGIRYYWIVDLERVVHFYALPAVKATDYAATGAMPLGELLASADLPAGVVL